MEKSLDSEFVCLCQNCSEAKGANDLWAAKCAEKLLKFAYKNRSHLSSEQKRTAMYHYDDTHKNKRVSN